MDTHTPAPSPKSSRGRRGRQQNHRQRRRVEMELELEAMRKHDFSWHPCRVSLRSSGVGLIVEYGTNDTDDCIVTKEEALSRLRIRSTPLHGDECSLLREGDRVLATRKSPPKSLFFDAQVEKPLRVRHSKKIHCRCMFVVRWIHHGREGETATIPSSAIMKMSAECITLHPTIVAFFSSLTTPNHCTISPLPTVLKGMDYERDVLQLEKQIEDISNAADSSGIKVSENLIDVDFKGQAQCKAISELNASDSSIQLPSFMNHMKEINDKGSSPAQEFDASRTPLNPNPIAGCAALASLMSKCSQDGKTATLVPKYENIVKTLFPSKEATREPKIVDASTEEMKQESKNEECRPQTVDSVANVSPKKNLDVAAGSTLSCSAKQRSSEASCKNVDMAFIAGQKPMPSMNTRRFTRSAVRKAEEKVVAEANNVIKENPSLVRGSALAQDQKTVVSPIDAETASTITHKFTDPEANTGIYKSNHFVKKSCAAGMLTLNNSRRLTRSAVRGKTENNNVESHKTFEESRLSDCVKIDIHNGDNVSESNASEAENAIPTTLQNGISSTHDRERCRQLQKSSLVRTIQDIEGDVASNDRRSHGVKRKPVAPKKQELRFSPRLRYLPRTRSQNQVLSSQGKKPL
ncbi:uncharacterized protein [Coffea arabica]|uniref:Uncharacterized protein isoform X1 n=1 Tax=Coffea arabica TaxID=13443 RepID=A0ABM4UK94_COFAR